MNEQSAVIERVLLRHDAAGVAWLTLNRPAARNALSMALMAALDEALAAIGQDPAVRVVVIGGAGPAFCAGHDLRELRANPDARRLRGAVRAVLAADDAHRAAAQAGDRARARRRRPRPAASSSRAATWRWPPTARASRRRASISACSARRRWWRCRAPSGARRRWRCC